MPGWLRKGIPDAQSLAMQGNTAGAALGALDAVARRQERCAGGWRQRLALATARQWGKQAGRVEDESALRDAYTTGRQCRAAGHLLLAWRRLAGSAPEKLLTDESIAGVLEDFGLARHDECVSDLMGNLRQLTASDGTVAMTTGAIAIAEGRALGAWLATPCWRNCWVDRHTRCRC